VVLENCLITGNTSSDYAISGANSAATKIVNCTVADNGPAGVGRYSTSWPFTVEIRNSILRNSGSEIGTGTVATISYSDVKGGYAGAGNIDKDPQFLAQADYHLAPGSPCIDAGAVEASITVDLDGVARPFGTGWDMGAYESTATTLPDTQAPVVQITSPSAEATVSGDVTIAALATDDRSGIARVEFRVDGTLISSSTAEPYSATWDASAAAFGDHVIEVTAIDKAGNSATKAVTVSVADTTPPTVQIMVPTDGTVVSGIAWFGAGAGDTESGISRVEFRADGNLFYTAWGGYMYIADWDSTGAAPGPHIIEVTAYDNAGNSASTSITVFILDATAPTVSITSPQDQAVVVGPVEITATATDADSGITRVEFAVDGANLATDTSPPYSAIWDATGAVLGSHTIKVTAYDRAGNSAVATRSVTVGTTDNSTVATPSVTVGTTGISAPSVRPLKPGHNKKTTFRAALSPGVAVASGTSELQLYRSETKIVRKKVAGHWKRVKVSYWRLRATRVMAAEAGGLLVTDYKVKSPGTWRAIVTYTGSPEYPACASGAKTFSVR
jgi:hypothetical protein